VAQEVAWGFISSTRTVRRRPQLAGERPKARLDAVFRTSNRNSVFFQFGSWIGGDRGPAIRMSPANHARNGLVQPAGCPETYRQRLARLIRHLSIASTAAPRSCRRCASVWPDARRTAVAARNAGEPFRQYRPRCSAAWNELRVTARAAGPRWMRRLPQRRSKMMADLDLIDPGSDRTGAGILARSLLLPFKAGRRVPSAVRLSAGKHDPDEPGADRYLRATQSGASRPSPRRPSEAMGCWRSWRCRAKPPRAAAAGPGCARDAARPFSTARRVRRPPFA